MFDVSVDTNLSAVAVRYGNAPQSVSASIVKRLRLIGASLMGIIVREKLSGNPLERRTGTLSRAIYEQVDVDGPDAVLTIGADKSKAPQAAIQEFGGTIVPTKAAHLAIPLDAARTARGVSRVSAREFMDNPQSLGFERAFVHRSLSGNLNILGVNGSQVEPVFALKDQVTLPERSYLRSTLRERKDWILSELGAAAREGANDAVNGQGDSSS
jgi:hypothetical protein